ncbi:MAG: GspE/PulE family protein [Candidatus Falkowbacteria bacterium]|nr:GspE/PulE family protein [Candidatus Falkowbacteria bacterium]
MVVNQNFIDKQKKLLDFVSSRSLISAQTAAELLAESSTSNKPVEEIIYEKNLINIEDFVKAKAAFLNFSYVDLADKEVPEEILNIVPTNVSEHYKIVAFDKDKDRVKVGLVDGENFKAIEAMDFLAQKNKLKVDYFLISSFSFNNVFSKYKNFSKEISSALAVKAKEDSDKKETDIKKDDTVQFEGIVKDAPVAKIVSVIIRHAVEGGASDIHIEPLPKETRVRYRIDGMLHNSLVLPKDIHASIVARIKVLSNLKLDETRSPQDGRIRLVINNREIDFRVSSMPLMGDEKIVMRVLDNTRNVFTLDNLGFMGHNYKVIETAIKKTDGIMLVTGPTGSGKTTTLYALLSLLNLESSNIVTLEDPVEYSMKGINQSQIRPEIGFTFASGLRSILRQDPDIIMVGEIRDNETAELAIHSALTGHLVVSTLHTKDAVGSIARLLDMKVEPFLLGSVLNMSMAQRLTRRICSYCKAEVKLEETFFQDLKKKLAEIPVDIIKQSIPDFDINNIKFYHGEGCSHCGKSGYRERVCIAEIVDVNSDMKNLILKKGGSMTIEDVRANQPFLTMQQDGLIKVIQGMTTIEEVMRVIQN